MKKASEDPQENIALKNHEIVPFFSNLHPTNFYATFNSQFFLIFDFYFNHKIPWGLETWEN